MTPRRFSSDSVQRRLRAIEDLLGELQQLHPFDGDELRSDFRSLAGARYAMRSTNLVSWVRFRTSTMSSTWRP